MASYEQNKSSGLWSVRFRHLVDGKEVNKRLSRWDDDIKKPPFKTKREAHKAYLAYMASPKGQPTFTPTSSGGDVYLYNDLIVKYFDAAKTENKESTQYDKQKAFANFITPHFTGKDMRGIDKTFLDDWVTALWNKTYTRTIAGKEVTRRYAPAYLKKIRGFLNNFLEFCKYRCGIPNPLTAVRVPRTREQKTPVAFWELTTFYKFIEAVDDIEFRTYCYFSFFTGLRIGEVLAFSEEDMRGNEIHVQHNLITKTMDGSPYKIVETKNYKNYTKTIPDVLATELEKYLAWKRANKLSGKHLFGGAEPLPETTIRRKLYAYIDKAKVNRITPHGFRHSYVAMLVHLGCSTKVVAELIGDTEEQVIRTYSHLYKDDKNAAVDKINTLVKGTILGTES